MLPVLPLVLFALTYLGLALGRVRGLALDRTGFAVLGAVAMLGTGCLTLDQARASIDAPTIAVLFGMMLLSVQYRMAGLHGAIVRSLARARRPEGLLFGLIVVTAGLSAELTNDVICYALTPLVVAAMARTRHDPLPYLLAIAGAANIGSALTPIGNPQNILIAQRLHLAFLPFVTTTFVPVVLSLGFLHLVLRRRLRERTEIHLAPTEPDVPLDRWQAAKAIALTVAAVVLFLTPIPAHLTALGIAGLVMVHRRMATREMLGLVDWPLLALFAGLFTVVRGLELSGWVFAARDGLLASGLDLALPSVLVPFAVLLGLVVGNVPAIVLALPLAGTGTPHLGQALALCATFAGNAILVGSVANIIVAEQAERMGVRMGFREHARVGVPVAIVSLGTAVAALALR